MFHPIRYFRTVATHIRCPRYRGMNETHESMGKGISYTVSVGYILRRLPTESFNDLKILLKSIAERKGTVRLTGLPPLHLITGIPEEGIPGINWEDFNVQAKPEMSKGDVLGHFIHHYFHDDNTLDLSRVGGFKEYIERLQRGQQVPLIMA